MNEARRPSRPIEVIRAELLGCLETRKLAETLGVPLEAYVEDVLRYASQPAIEPELYVIEEEDAEAEGIELPSEAEVRAWLEDVQAGRVVLGPRALEAGFVPSNASEARIHRLLSLAAALPEARPERGAVLATGARGVELKLDLERALFADHRRG